MSNKETMENEQESGNLVQRFFGKINQKIERFERYGDDLLQTNPKKFHNFFIYFSLGLAIVFFGYVAISVK